MVCGCAYFIHHLLLKATIGVGIAEAIIGLMQISPISFLLPTNLVYHSSPAIGTIGNPEFLATFLGLCIFLCLFFLTQQTAQKKKWIWILGIIMLTAGLIATQSKGTLLFMVLLGLWFLLKNTSKSWAVMTMVALGAAYLSWFSIKSRLMLWIVAFFLFSKNMLLGIGFGQFNNHYINTLSTLFTQYPILSTMFDTYSANVQHAHNFVFHYSAELGLFGLIFSILVYIGFFRLFRMEKQPILNPSPVYCAPLLFWQ